MLSVKLVRSLVLGETIINNPFTHHHHTHDDNDNDNDNDDDNDTHTHTHAEYDADDDDDAHLQRRTLKSSENNNEKDKLKKKKKKMPLLLFIPTKELISDTFRLATIARDIGMDFHPSSSLSHLLFSWPSPPSSSSSSSPLQLPSLSSSYSPLSPFSSSSSNNRPSVSSNATTSTSTSSSLSLWGSTTIPNDAVPLPFPSLSTSSSISLLRYFVSLTKGLFKLVFLEIDDNSRFSPNNLYNCKYNYDSSSNVVALVSRVSGKPMNSMEDFSRVLAGNGWALFRSSEKKNTASSCSVYMFRKMDSHRVRAKKMINGCDGGGECRIRELRLPALDFKNGVPLRILQYILLMTDDIFYLA